MSTNVINKTELSERLDNDFELFKELAALFFDDSASLLNKIKSSIEGKDVEALRKNSHTLKGAVSNFSAQQAYDAAYELETAGRNNDLAGIEKKLLNLEKQIDAVILEMKSMMSLGSF